MQVPIGEPKELPPDWQGLEAGQHGPELSVEEQERAIEVLEGYTQVNVHLQHSHFTICSCDGVLRSHCMTVLTRQSCAERRSL
jgi:hypothetical protein